MRPFAKGTRLKSYLIEMPGSYAILHTPELLNLLESDVPRSFPFVGCSPGSTWRAVRRLLGGNLCIGRAIVGIRHSDVDDAATYAHLSEEHETEAIDFGHPAGVDTTHRE